MKSPQLQSKSTDGADSEDNLLSIPSGTSCMANKTEFRHSNCAP
jgi:hypothetical protein